MPASARDEPPDVPSGTVTFLFTDIEGSTKLLERLREQYATVLSDQRDLLRAAFAQHNGFEIDTQGDAFFVAFPRALDAVQCVIDAQHALAAHAWPEAVVVRVRMGLHTGEPLLARTGYVGLDVHRAARIAAAGHGGQALLSQTTRDLIYQDLPAGAALRDLGQHQLKDIRFPQSIFQLDIDGLPADFPPLKTLAASEEPPAPGETPFKGLQYFDEADTDLFFGRESLTRQLVEHLCGQRFLAVIGASGSGKSSIVRAGLVPALKRGGASAACADVAWQVCVLTPTAHPLETLAASLTRASGSLAATARLIDDLKADTRSLHLYVQQRLRLDQRGAHAADQERVLVVVDQFEELFTLCREPAEQQAFVDNLVCAATSDGGGATVVLTLRADFYEHLAAYPALRELVAKHQEYIGAMNAAELRQAIEAPAAHGGWEFSAGLVELLLHDVGAEGGREPEPGALPLLSHALLATWQRRRGHLMNLRAYSESGGVRRAIAHTAEGVYHNDLSLPQQLIARDIFLRLTELGEGTQDTRRRVALAELMRAGEPARGSQVEQVLARLAAARLITLGEGTVEVAHEALIREWPTLRGWLDEDREGLRLHRHLTEAALAWARLNRDPGELYRGARLSQAGDWANGHPGQLNVQEQEFLEASQAQAGREAAEREAQQQRELAAAQRITEATQALAAAEKKRADENSRAAVRLRGRAIYLAGALGLALLLAAAAVWLGIGARQAATTAQTSARLSFSRELAAAALSNLEVDPERSLLLSLQALTVTYSVDETWLPEVEDALHRSLEASRLEVTLHHPGPITAVAFSPDGSHLATASDAGTAAIWDLATQTMLFTLSTAAHVEANALAFSYDGNRLATSSVPGSVEIWDATTGHLMQTLHGNVGPVVAIRFSHDDAHLGAVSEEGSGIVWDIATGQPQYGLQGAEGVLALSFNSDGTRVATLNGDGLTGDVTIWDAVTGKSLLDFPGPGAGQISFSADGSRLTTVYGTALTVWDALSGRELLTETLAANADQIINVGSNPNLLFANVVDATSFQENVNQIENVAFSPDGTRLATSISLNRKALVWDAATGQLLLALSGHTGLIGSVAFSPDGSQLATASKDGTVRVWNIGLSQELLTIAAPRGADGHLVLSHDGQRVAMGVGIAGQAKIWDASTGQELATISEQAPVESVTLSPDGARLATTSLERPPALWNAHTGQLMLTLHGLLGQVNVIAFSPDGARLVAVNDRDTIQYWDPASGQPLTRTTTTSSVPMLAVVFSPDGTRLATSRQNGITEIREAATAQTVLVLTNTSAVRGLAFSPDGAWLATGTDAGTAQIWDAATGQPLRTLSGHTGPVAGVAFSPDGKRLATASRDGTAKLWDAASGQLLLTLLGSGRGLGGVAFSPDGNRLFTSGDDGIRVYVLPIGDLAALARTRVTRDFTLAECQQYLHLTQCPASGK